MASPQLEDGYTEIANEILEALMRIYLPPNQWQVLLCIIRRTYGFKKKVDWIANSQIAEATGLVKSTVSRALRGLEQQALIIRDGKHIAFKKDWEQWKVSNSANTEELTGLLTTEPEDIEKLAGQLTSEKLAVRKPELAAGEYPPIPLPPHPLPPTPLQKQIYKRKYGEFQNVLLTDEEFQKLKDRLGRQAEAMIERLSAYKESSGKKYKSDYATMLNWQRRDDGKARNPRDLPKTYADSPNYPDLA